jgi:glycosyltransferase involved in cell wall biosynthesis
VRNGENGILVPPGDTSALVGALVSLLADSPRRAELGRTARTTVESEFTPERELQRNLEIYRIVMRDA